MGGIDSDLKECAGIDQALNSLPGREPAFTVLALDSLRSSALADYFFFIADGGNQIGHETHVSFKARRGGIDASG